MLIYNKYDKKKLLAVIVLVTFRLIDESWTIINILQFFEKVIEVISNLYDKKWLFFWLINKLVLSDTE